MQCLCVAVECIFDPFGRNQFPAMLNLSLQQSSLSVEQNSIAPSSSSQTVIRMLLLTLLGLYSFDFYRCNVWVPDKITSMSL